VAASAEVRGILKRPFAEQVAFFRAKLGNLVPTAAWDDLWKAQHDRAFMVAGAAKADLLADLAAAVDRSISEGGSIGQFRKDFDAIVARHGWAYNGERNWRTRTIYRTNAATSYAAGRLAQLREGGFPFWMYKHGGSADPRPQHLAWDGMVLPSDHPFWNTHSPPNGWGCSCRIVGVRDKDMARRLGGKPDKALPEGWDEVSAKTGELAGIDKGWGYQPGATADALSVAGVKLETLPSPLASSLGDALAPVIDRQFPAWVDDVLDGKTHRPGLVGAIARADIDLLDARGIAPSGAEIYVKPGLLHGPKALRHQKKGDALSPDEWRALPTRLRNPMAVLLDVDTRNLIYVLAGPDRVPQFAVALDYWIKADGRKQQVNAIVSAYRPRIADLRARILAPDAPDRAGGFRLLRGKIG
jgi:hypothetical protein